MDDRKPHGDLSNLITEIDRFRFSGEVWETSHKSVTQKPRMFRKKSQPRTGVDRSETTRKQSQIGGQEIALIDEPSQFARETNCLTQRVPSVIEPIGVNELQSIIVGKGLDRLEKILLLFHHQLVQEQI